MVHLRLPRPQRGGNERTPLSTAVGWRKSCSWGHTWKKIHFKFFPPPHTVTDIYSYIDRTLKQFENTNTQAKLLKEEAAVFISPGNIETKTAIKQHGVITVVNPLAGLQASEPTH